MALTTGLRIGAYEIVSPLGVGGMGEVYRARDTKLNRDVALKVLPEAFSLDPDRLARFKREAQVLASLNHPNIAHIHGLEDSTAISALVMELVEGPTVADRLAKGPIPLDEALPIARQITEALEAAHEQGIIHRDLKPANIKVRPDGVVKVLDFGLAKIGREVVGEALSQLATETVSGTRYGVILGTTAYMSPEQTRGLPVDQRTDVWAFGCVLYEMLSGRSAFAGNTISDTIAHILEHEPDWRALPKSTPRTVRELTRRCLQKDLQYRLHGLAIARHQIDDAATYSSRRKIVGPLGMSTGVTLALTIVATLWWQPWKKTPLLQRELASTQQQPVSNQREPVTIVIADFQNGTSDPAFDHTLEAMLRRALESASFISAYDRSRIRTGFGVQPPEKFDDVAARELALKQGVGVIFSGSIDGRGNGYDITLKAAQTVTGKVIASTKTRVSNKDQVLGAATKLVTTIRKALGDETSDSDQLLAMKSLSTTSMEVASHYAAAIEAQSKAEFEEARRSFLKTVELDPNFGLGYQGLAIMSRNLGKLQDAEKYASEALRHLEGMTDRERFAVRGSYYMLAGDYQQCVKEYGELVAHYAADAVAHNQRAVCFSKLRNMREAVDEMRRALQILPNRLVYRYNLAVFLGYAGDFQTAEQEVRAILNPTTLTTVALAFSQLGQGHLPEATATYETLTTLNPLGASIAVSGLGDLALQEGRFAEAVQILDRGAAIDLASKNGERAARKFASLAYAQLWRRQDRLAIAAAEKALANGRTGAIRFLAARVFVQAGAVARARTEAARISLGTFVSPGLRPDGGGPAAEPEAYAKIIEAEIALKNEDPRQAIRLLTEANTLSDTWLGHFDLGLAYLKVPVFAEADAEFDRCLKRRGEALSLFFDEEPTYGFFPPVFYYQGVAREGLNRPEFVESFRAYITLRGKSTEDPLLRKLRNTPSFSAGRTGSK